MAFKSKDLKNKLTKTILKITNSNEFFNATTTKPTTTTSTTTTTISILSTTLATSTTSTASTFTSTNLSKNNILNETLNETTTRKSLFNTVPSITVSTDFCQKTHTHSFCNYLVICIFFGYLLRLFVMPFVMHRIEKLKHQLRGDYNFSLLWLWLFATMPFIDIIEFIASSNSQVYTRTISFLNVIILICTLYTIVKYVYYYGFTKDNYPNYLTSISFIIIWITLVSLRSMVSKSERKRTIKFKDSSYNGSLFPVYFIIYVAFASAQVFKNTTNKTGRCLTHASFCFWLLSSFFLSSYQLIIESPKYDYIHYRTFFEISTLLVILFQNIYYRDGRHKRELIRTLTDNNDREMIVNPPIKSILKKKKFDPFARERSNSGYLYFNNEENIIDENILKKNENILTEKTLNDDDETYFDKNQVTNKLTLPNDSSASSATSNFNNNNNRVIEYNDSLQSNEQQGHNDVYQDNLSIKKSILRQKLGIFFSYTDNRLWLMILSAFCVVYYLFAYITLVRAVKLNILVFAVPLIHPVTICLSVIARNCCLNKK